ncbi:MAG: CDP-glycerol glycerophosphotransferase family protein, partial [Gaiellaceae bacterium]
MKAGRLPGLRRLPTLMQRVDPDVVLFFSWGGRVADNPKAVAEELRRRDASLEHVWVLAEGSQAPEAATVVRPGSLAHLEQLGRARYIVSSNVLPGFFRKKRATSYLQTWHGTPLKRIAFDMQDPRFATGRRRYFAMLEREISSWDSLVSPNGFSTEVLRRAFRYEGEIVETGYPRNDVLSAPDRELIRARVRKELGIADGVCAVLYAPTWRDDASFSTELDLVRLAAELGDGYTMLLRVHNSVAATVAVDERSGVVNVSGRDDLAELYLAADVLITDYSSVMFDFAVTRKPMLFFTYDLAWYRDELRGFYFDFESEAPGPLIDGAADL